jgi:hypothetical protein
MEGRLQSALDLCAGHPKRQSSSYQIKVRFTSFVLQIFAQVIYHTKNSNTQERKPVTNSRDTQELLPDAGQEMLRIFHTHPARTSLLQDFAFYEVCQRPTISSRERKHSFLAASHTKSASPRNSIVADTIPCPFATAPTPFTHDAAPTKHAV